MKSHLLALTAITAILVAASTLAAGFTEGAQLPPTTLKLKPGEFVWKPGKLVGSSSQDAVPNADFLFSRNQTPN